MKKPEPPPAKPNSLVIWRFTDGKPGHEKQTLGLSHALAALTPCQIIDIPVQRGLINAWHWLTGRFPAGAHVPAPQLLIGAGHSTHLPLLAARRARGGKIVLLMAPSLPLAWFDLCLIPEHDRPPSRRNVIPTQGALNTVTPGNRHDPNQGLVLVGGPSPHFQWDSASIAHQIHQLAAKKPQMRWTLSTSRRTPSAFLGQIDPRAIHCLPAENTPPGWLEAQLAQTGEAWVTPDSVSMVFEALTSGARVGVLDLPPVANSRVAKGLLQLKSAGRIALFPDLEPKSNPDFNESQRCARRILERWLP